MNTIVVSLAILPDDCQSPPKGLDISWKPTCVKFSKIQSRNYATKSAIVYCVENFFEFCTSVRKKYPQIFSHYKHNDSKSKAEGIIDFLISTNCIEEELVILAELACHWRNKIIHCSSNAELSKNKISKICLENEITNGLKIHNFDVTIALNNFKNNTITLKDASTLATVLIRCAKKIDEYIVNNINSDYSVMTEILKSDKLFLSLINSHSYETEVVDRKLSKYVSVNFPFISKANIELILRSKDSFTLPVHQS